MPTTRGSTPLCFFSSLGKLPHYCFVSLIPRRSKGGGGGGGGGGGTRNFLFVYLPRSQAFYSCVYFNFREYIANATVLISRVVREGLGSRLLFCLQLNVGGHWMMREYM